MRQLSSSSMPLPQLTMPQLGSTAAAVGHLLLPGSAESLLMAVTRRSRCRAAPACLPAGASPLLPQQIPQRCKTIWHWGHPDGGSLMPKSMRQCCQAPICMRNCTAYKPPCMPTASALEHCMLVFVLKWTIWQPCMPAGALGMSPVTSKMQPAVRWPLRPTKPP